MGIYVEVLAEDKIEVINWRDKSSGRDRSMSKQKAYLHGVGRYPVEYSMMVDDVRGPYRPGKYVMAGECFKPGEFALMFDARRMYLQPIEEALAEIFPGGQELPFEIASDPVPPSVTPIPTSKRANAG